MGMGSLKRHREEECYICGHYHNYEGGEQCKICGHVLQTLPVTIEHSRASPSEILPGFLYLGDYNHASSCSLLKAIGITHILCVVPSCQSLFKYSFSYHKASASPADLQECFQFLDKAKDIHGRVLVHCMTGMARSCEVVIAYVIKLRAWSLEESIDLVKTRHRACDLGHAEMIRLQAFELQARQASLTTLHQSGHEKGQEVFVSQGLGDGSRGISA